MKKPLSFIPFIFGLHMTLCAAASGPCALSVADFGARANGEQSDQQAVQNAIDQCSKQGGGRVCFPSGNYIWDEVFLRDYVTLVFEPNTSFTGMLHVEGVRQVGIEGDPSSRVVTGNIRFRDIEHLQLRNIESEHGWVIHDGRGVTIENVKIEQEMRRQANGLAITFVDSRDVYVSNCELTCNDDAFCLKRSGENIHITSSLICGRQAASFKIGTETDGVFRNITMTHCVIYNSNRAGINIEAVDGSDIDGVRISDIEMYNVAAPFFIRLGNRDRYAKGIGSIRNIDISNIHYVGMQHDEGIGSSVQGLPGHPVENVTFRNIHITTQGGGEKALTYREVPERENFYPEYDIYGKFPAYGLYSRHVKGLRLENVVLDYVQPDLRPAIFCTETEDLTLDGLQAQSWIPKNQYLPPFDSAEASIYLHQVNQVLIRNQKAPVTSPLVAVYGDRSGDISLVDIDTRLSLVPPYRIDKEVTGALVMDQAIPVAVQSLTAEVVKSDRPVPLVMEVRNTGKAGYGYVNIYVDGEFASKRWFYMPASASKQLSMELPPVYEVRTYEIRAGKEMVSWKPEPAAPSWELSWTEKPGYVAAGSPFSIKINAKNIGSVSNTEQLEIKASGNTLDQKSITLAPGEETLLTFQGVLNEVGQVEVSCRQLSTTLSVNPIWIDKNGNHQLDDQEPNFSDFQQALEAASSGDVILINPGTFTIDSSSLPIRITKDNITVKGAMGQENTIIKAVHADEEQFENHALFSVTANDVRLEGMTLSTGVYNVYVKGAKNIEIRDVFFNVSRRYHILLEDSEHVTIENNRSRVGRYNFLTMRNSNHCRVAYNYHYEDPCGYMVQESDHNEFIGNQFDSLSWYGITLLNAHHNVIEDNLFNSGRILGLQCRRSCNDNKVVRNTFVNNRTEAILIGDQAKNNTFSQNNIVGNRGLAITNELNNRSIDARRNWYGSPSGPSGQGPGNGDSVGDRVKYEPWLKEPVKNSWMSYLQEVN